MVLSGMSLAPTTCSLPRGGVETAIHPAADRRRPKLPLVCCCLQSRRSGMAASRSSTPTAHNATQTSAWSPRSCVGRPLARLYRLRLPVSEAAVAVSAEATDSLPPLPADRNWCVRALGSAPRWCQVPLPLFCWTAFLCISRLPLALRHPHGCHPLAQELLPRDPMNDPTCPHL